MQHRKYYIISKVRCVIFGHDKNGRDIRGTCVECDAEPYYGHMYGCKYGKPVVYAPLLHCDGCDDMFPLSAIWKGRDTWGNWVLSLCPRCREPKVDPNVYTRQLDAGLAADLVREEMCDRDPGWGPYFRRR